MERCCSEHESVLGCSPEDSTARPDDMEVLGRPSASVGSALCTPTKPERPHGPVTTGNVLQLLEWQGYRCALTGRPLTPDMASLDHVVPVRNGGEHRIEKVQVLHKEVNRAKSTMTNEEFVQLCREVVEYATRHPEGGEP
ncbi:MAG: hypothetical protein KatS3mg105_2227 [Gemmatales bacterium]|nr:MAG: hypothetical protein KatS3mg105_2227 [Gemmatales bacterium]